jgi:hypothetical protein
LTLGGELVKLLGSGAAAQMSAESEVVGILSDVFATLAKRIRQLRISRIG